MKITGLVIKNDNFSTTRHYVCTGREIAVVEIEDPNNELKEGSLVELTGEHTNYTFKATEASEITDKHLEKQITEFLQFTPAKVKQVINAPSLLEMEDYFNEACETIVKAIFELRAIKIRYDDDADAILSALILKNAIETFGRNKKIPVFLRFQESVNGAVYKMKDEE